MPRHFRHSRQVQRSVEWVALIEDKYYTKIVPNTFKIDFRLRIGFPKSPTYNSNRHSINNKYSNRLPSPGSVRETPTRATNARGYFFAPERTLSPPIRELSRFAPGGAKEKIYLPTIFISSNDVYDQQNCPQSGSPHDRRPQIGSVSRNLQIGVSRPG